MNRTISTINVLPKHRRQRMSLLSAGFRVTVAAHTVDDIRDDLKVVGLEFADLDIEPIEDGVLVDVSLFV